jgi:cell wall-associated NlpC family hydrolase
MLAISGSVIAGCSAAPQQARAPGLVGFPAGPERPGAGPAERVVRFAAAQIGKRYCWGGVGPECFDCSGLVQQSWRAVGVWLPRTADAIASTEPEVPLEDARMGDVLWWPGHVGIYAGDGWVIDAYDSRHGVVRRPARRPRRAFRPMGLAPHPAPLSQSLEQGCGRPVEVGANIEDDVRPSGID